jgi:hypothetical protein
MAPQYTKVYNAVLSAFMSYRDSTVYDKDHIFAQNELSAITPEDLGKYFYFKAYGREDPDEEDHADPCRSSTLHFYKKAVSYYIPNKHMQWNVDSRIGNPTKSPLTNSLIRDVKQLECRDKGIPSQARRELTKAEFCIIIRISEKNHTVPNLQIRLPTMAKFQLHLIACIDDTAHVRLKDLRVHPQHDFALTICLCWTKNCMEEQDAPEQIILGANDSGLCLVVGLAIYLQYSLEFTNTNISKFLFCNSDESPNIQ